MTDVSEAEVAAVLHVFDEYGMRASINCARAVLTAAAQVREKAAANGLELLTGLLVTVVDVGWPLTKGETQAMRLTAAAAGQILRVLDQPAVVAPMPIYGATEPDQGEDILGIRKGEG